MSLDYNFKKMCCFYVSLIHLVTMLLPYISKCIDEEKEIVTILEQDLQENVEKLLSRMNLSKEKTNEILKINWKAINKLEMNNYLNQNEKNNMNIINNNKLNIEKETSKEKIIIVLGTKEYMKEVNNELQNSNLSEKDVVINCFDINSEKMNLKEILDAHSKVINTLGEKEISEVFIGYKVG